MIVINNRPTIIGTSLLGTSVSLKPGLNDIGQVTWEAMSRIPLIASMVEDGELVVHNAGPAAAASVETLDGFKTPEAIELVKATMDLALLDKWATSDNRAGVLKAIQKQQDLLSKDADEKAGTTEEG